MALIPDKLYEVKKTKILIFLVHVTFIIIIIIATI